MVLMLTAMVAMSMANRSPDRPGNCTLMMLTPLSAVIAWFTVSLLKSVTWITAGAALAKVVSSRRLLTSDVAPLLSRRIADNAACSKVFEMAGSPNGRSVFIGNELPNAGNAIAVNAIDSALTTVTARCAVWVPAKATVRLTTPDAPAAAVKQTPAPFVHGPTTKIPLGRAENVSGSSSLA